MKPEVSYQQTSHALGVTGISGLTGAEARFSRQSFFVQVHVSSVFYILRGQMIRVKELVQGPVVPRTIDVRTPM